MLRTAVLFCLALSLTAPIVIHGSGRQIAPAPAPTEYVLGPDSQVRPGVPQGTVTQHSWTSAIYPGTVRDYWVYVPAQYDRPRPPA
jgi:hypothetical protein